MGDKIKQLGKEQQKTAKVGRKRVIIKIRAKLKIYRMKQQKQNQRAG